MVAFRRLSIPERDMTRVTWSIFAFYTPLSFLFDCTTRTPLMGYIGSKWKPELKFQDGGRLLSQTGSSNMSAVDWDIWSKFAMPVALDLPKFQAWPNQQPEVDLRRYGRHLVKSIWRHNSVGDHPICIKFGRPVQNHKMPMTVKSSSKPAVEFKYGGRLFSATRNSNNLAVDWDIRSKFDTQIVLCLPEGEMS